MSEEQLKELQEYNLEYLEAQNSEEIFGGDYTSAVELKFAKKEIERLNKKIEQYENPEDMTLMFMWCDEKAKDEIKRLNNIINELEKWLEEEQDRLARETSNIYEDSLGKTRLVNENIYEEVQKIKDKLHELKGE